MNAESMCLPDPENYIMIAMRLGNVELAACVRPDRADDEIEAVAKALLEVVQKEATA